LSEETIFDRILAKESPANIVYEDEEILAFSDINPQAPVHVLVIPKKKVSGFSDLVEQDAEQTGRFIAGVARVAQELEVDQKGYRVVFNSGRHGQQTVEYLHAHILGGRQLNWPPG
jgi:histidine triad (HIT) family protein